MKQEFPQIIHHYARYTCRHCRFPLRSFLVWSESYIVFFCILQFQSRCSPTIPYHTNIPHHLYDPFINQPHTATLFWTCIRIFLFCALYWVSSSVVLSFRDMVLCSFAAFRSLPMLSNDPPCLSISPCPAPFYTLPHTYLCLSFQVNHKSSPADTLFMAIPCGILIY